jgi:hypothetical protein
MRMGYPGLVPPQPLSAEINAAVREFRASRLVDERVRAAITVARLAENAANKIRRMDGLLREARDWLNSDQNIDDERLAHLGRLIVRLTAEIGDRQHRPRRRK